MAQPTPQRFLRRRYAASFALAVAAAVMMLRANHVAEKSAPDRAGIVWSTAHTLVFLVRKTLLVGFSRIFGWGGSQYGWSAVEEVAMRVLNFFAHLSDVHVPNTIIDFYGKLNELGARRIHGVSVVNVGPEMLGFGPDSSGCAKFGPEVECTAKWITLSEDTKFLGRGVKTILFYHGGGYNIGNPLMYLPAMAQLLRCFTARQHGDKVGILSIDYPMAPRFRFPIPIEAGFHVYEFLCKEKRLLAGSDVIVMGDSAGGNLAVNVAMRATKLGLAGAVLISPWVGFDVNTPSQIEFANVDLIGGPLLQAQYQQSFFPGGNCIEASMLQLVDKHGPFSSLPPVWLSFGEVEVFRDDIRRFANVLDSHEATLKLNVGSNAPHIFPMLWPLFYDESSKALNSISEFCVERFVEAADEAKVRAKSVRKFEKILKVGENEVGF